MHNRPFEVLGRVGTGVDRVIRAGRRLLIERRFGDGIAEDHHVMPRDCFDGLAVGSTVQRAVDAACRPVWQLE